MDFHEWFQQPQTRRRVLKRMGIVAGAGTMIGSGIYSIEQVLAASPLRR